MNNLFKGNGIKIKPNKACHVWYVHEEWKDVKGYGNKYEISSYGRCRNKKTKHILKPQVLYKRTGDGKSGYLRYALFVNNKQRWARAHRLVAIAFIPNPEHKPQVNHKDNNPQNNCVKNLEWVSNEENQAHAKKLRRVKNP